MEDIRYLILNKEGKVMYRYKRGTRFQWDFSVPSECQGGRSIDLDSLDAETRERWLAQG